MSRRSMIWCRLVLLRLLPLGLGGSWERSTRFHSPPTAPYAQDRPTASGEDDLPTPRFFQLSSPAVFALTYSRLLDLCAADAREPAPNVATTARAAEARARKLRDIRTDRHLKSYLNLAPYRSRTIFGRCRGAAAAKLNTSAVSLNRWLSLYFLHT